MIIKSSADGLRVLLEKLPEAHGSRDRLDRAITMRRQALQEMKPTRKKWTNEKCLAVMLLRYGYYSVPIPVDEIAKIYGVPKPRAGQMVKEGLELLRYPEFWTD